MWWRELEFLLGRRWEVGRVGAQRVGYCASGHPGHRQWASYVEGHTEWWAWWGLHYQHARGGIFLWTKGMQEGVFSYGQKACKRGVFSYGQKARKRGYFPMDKRHAKGGIFLWTKGTQEGVFSYGQKAWKRGYFPKDKRHTRGGIFLWTKGMQEGLFSYGRKWIYI